MKKIFIFLSTCILLREAYAQLQWQMKCDISNINRYVNGSMHFFDFKASNHNEGFIINGDSIRTTSNSGQTWNAPKVLPRNGFAFGTEAIGYANNGSTIYAATWKQIYRSVDGGNTFTLQVDTLKYAPYCYAAKDNFIVFGFDAHAIALSKDGGATWVEKRLADKAGRVHMIHIISDNVVLVSVSNAAYYTKDGGTTWSEFTPPPGNYGTKSSYSFTGIDDNNWFIAFTDGKQYLFKTTDGGTSWIDIKPNWGPETISYLYATTDGKLFGALTYYQGKPAGYQYSLDKGQTWIRDSLDAPVPSKIAGFRQIGNKLYALSYLNSTPEVKKIFTLDLSGSNATEDYVSANPPVIGLFPNPTANKLYIECDNVMERIWLTDLLGRAIDSPQIINAHRAEVDVSHLHDAGTYFLHIQFNSGKWAVKPFVKE